MNDNPDQPEAVTEAASLAENAPDAFERVELLGAEVDALTKAQLLTYIKQAHASGERRIVANHNLHSLQMQRQHPEMKRLFAVADLIHIDGMPIVFHAKLLGLPVEREHRLTHLDWVHDVLGMAEAEAWTVFYLGSDQQTLDQILSHLRSLYPKLNIHGHTGYFDKDDPEENKRICEKMREVNADYLYVGMGMPRQENWIYDNRNDLPPCIVQPCGALLEYMVKPELTPPRWTGRLGLEWAYRLFCEPRRLFRRYLIEPWGLLPLAVRDFVHYRIKRQRADKSPSNASS